MLISGIQQCTLLDYPEKVACIVFTPGCNFRCGYCHNPEFVLPEKIVQLKNSFIPEEAFFKFLKTRGTRVETHSRASLLDGVVISGGEPTLMPDLIPFMRKIKSLRFLVKLDTNGNRPAVVERAIAEGLVDYIAMDVKTSLAGYRTLVGPFVVEENIKKSIELIRTAGIDYEFRTTLIKEVHSDILLREMKVLFEGARRVCLQTFRPEQTLSPLFKSFHPFSTEEMAAIAHEWEEAVEGIHIR